MERMGTAGHRLGIVPARSRISREDTLPLGRLWAGQ